MKRCQNCDGLWHPDDIVETADGVLCKDCWTELQEELDNMESRALCPHTEEEQ